MRYFEIIREGRDAPLYHGINFEYAHMAITNNELVAATSQRFWADGLRRKDNDPDYEGSFWMKGVSTTRDMRFAMRWRGIVFELDQSKISQNYKIVPFNWGYSIPSENHHKREREEFIVKKSTWDTYMHPADEYDDKPRFDYNRFAAKEGSIKPLSKFLTGIYIDSELPEMQPKSDFSILTNHPLFKGYYHPDTLKVTGSDWRQR